MIPLKYHAHMVICLESSILGGYLTNEVPGLVTGMIHLAGQKRPLRVELNGNFLRDIAGCRVDFLNPLPDTDTETVKSLSLTQTGHAGVMTASHRAGRLPRRKTTLVDGWVMPDPPGLKNLAFFEWFNQDQQRILIQSWHIQMRVSAPRWQLSKEAETAQLRQNRARRKHFLLSRSRENPPPPASIQGLASPVLPNPFADDDAARDPFAATDTIPEPETKSNADTANPMQRSAALAEELRRFERLIQGHVEIGSRPAVLRLLATVADLAAHLTHALRQFAEGGRTQWHFLVVDLEQSLPIFAAALNACDRLTEQSPPGTDTRWLGSLQRCLLSVELRMRELLKLLRGS